VAGVLSDSTSKSTGATVSFDLNSNLSRFGSLDDVSSVDSVLRFRFRFRDADFSEAFLGLFGLANVIDRIFLSHVEILRQQFRSGVRNSSKSHHSFGGTLVDWLSVAGSLSPLFVNRNSDHIEHHLPVLSIIV